MWNFAVISRTKNVFKILFFDRLLGHLFLLFFGGMNAYGFGYSEVVTKYNRSIFQIYCNQVTRQTFIDLAEAFNQVNEVIRNGDSFNLSSEHIDTLIEIQLYVVSIAMNHGGLNFHGERSNVVCVAKSEQWPNFSLCEEILRGLLEKISNKHTADYHRIILLHHTANYLHLQLKDDGQAKTIYESCIDLSNRWIQIKGVEMGLLYKEVLETIVANARAMLAEIKPPLPESLSSISLLHLGRGNKVSDYPVPALSAQSMLEDSYDDDSIYSESPLDSDSFDNEDLF